MNDNFKIDQLVIGDLDKELLWDAECSLLKKVIKARERQLGWAFYRGYDFLDVRTDGRNIEFIPWNEGNEPSFEGVNHPSERYDMRGVTFADLRKAMMSKNG